jgi:hypothetical protein
MPASLPTLSHRPRRSQDFDYTNLTGLAETLWVTSARLPSTVPEEAMARLARQLRYLYLAFFSQPVRDRGLYRHIWRHKSHRILELGVGTTERARRLIEVAALAGADSRVCYTGIDLFEMRGESDAPGVSLKLAHRELQATGARIRLVPGSAQSALAQTANSLGPHDLVLIAADQPDESLAQAWFYIPRVLAAGGSVFRQQPTKEGQLPLWRVMPAAELQALTQPPPRRRAA